jgi:putative hydrolase
MADPPSTGGDPFSGMPFFGDLARAMAGQGPINWDAARQFAQLGATGGTPEANVDPTTRVSITNLAPIARLHVGDLTGVDLATVDPVTVTRSQWAAETLEAYRPLFVRLAESLAAPAPDGESADPMAQMMAGLSRLMGPAMIGMAVGSMVGNLAQHCFGTHDLPIPRTDGRVSLIGSTIDAFAREWDVPVDEMRLWVLAHEYAGWAVLASPTLRGPLTDLVSAHVGAFRPDPDAVAERLAGLDMTSGDAFAGIQQAFSDPEVLLGAVRSDEQRALEPRLDATVAAVLGLTDWIVDAVAVRVVGGGALRIAEAVRRRRVEAAPSDVFVHRLLGIRVDDGCVRRGKEFVQGVVDRAGESAIVTMIAAPDGCPTPAEIEAPGLWLARVTGA